MLMLLYLFAVSRFPGKWEDRDKERTKDVAWEEKPKRGIIEIHILSCIPELGAQI